MYQYHCNIYLIPAVLPFSPELVSIQLQARVQQLGEEKERLLNSLLEAELVPISVCNWLLVSDCCPL